MLIKSFKPEYSAGARFPLVAGAARLLLVFASLMAMPTTTPAFDRVPQTSNDLPFYARLERGLDYSDGEWAAVAFYRPPDCIRPDFNLLDFFDVPAAFGCNAEEPYLNGFGIFQGGPFDPPIQSRLMSYPGSEMPVWFLSSEDMESAIADDSITIGELSNLPSLQEGKAAFYSETLHPFGGAKQSKLSIVAMGFLEDERRFRFFVTETHGTMPHVEIDFD